MEESEPEVSKVNINLHKIDNYKINDWIWKLLLFKQRNLSAIIIQQIQAHKYLLAKQIVFGNNVIKKLLETGKQIKKWLAWLNKQYLRLLKYYLKLLTGFPI